MSVAFSAVVLYIIFVPGFIFRRAYLSIPFSRKYAVSSPFDDIAAIILAIILQAAMCGMAQRLSPYRIDFAVLGELIVGTKSDLVQSSAFSNIQEHLGTIAAYNFSLWAVAGLLGCGFRLIVLNLRLDTLPLFRFLRFSNIWYYFFTGRQWALREGEDFDLVWLDALAQVGQSTTLYSGRLHSYFLAPDGGLDSICLSDAQRWPPHNPGASTGTTPVLIPGQGFVIKYSQILNLNITFYRITAES